VASGELVALVSSDGRVEIAARDASAADLLGVTPGAEVKLAVTK
jgi:S-adenosylmethionine hydrolase